MLTPARGARRTLDPRPHAARAWGALLLVGYVAIRGVLESRYELFDPDEALEMLAAASLRDGRLPYTGALSHRGPFLTVLYLVPSLLFGPNAYRAVHAFAVALFVALAAWFQRSVARATTERVGLMALASLLLLGTLRVPAEDNWGLNADFLMGGLVMAAMGPLLAARRRPDAVAATGGSSRRLVPYVAAGALLALAFLTKQSAAPLVLVPITYVVVADRDRALAKLGAFAAAFAVPLALVAGVYVAKGELSRAWFFFYGYNRDYVAAAYVNGSIQAVASDAIWIGRSYGELLALAAAGVFAVGAARDAAPWVLAAAWTLAGLVAAALPGKHWDNYLWASHAPVALLGALGGGALLELVERRGWAPVLRRTSFGAIVAVPILGCMSSLGRGRTVLSTATDVGGIAAPRVPRRELVELIARFSRADEALYVTAYAPEMYVLAARRPASRHVISNFVETVYPGRFDRPSRIVPLFFAELREDLMRSRPRVILDACALGFLCHPSSALTVALPHLLDDYHPAPGAPAGVYVRND